MNTRRLLLFTALLSIFYIPSIAQPLGWSGNQAFTVTNNTSTIAIGFQVPVTINTAALISANQLQANGADARFGKECNGATIYPHYLDSAFNTVATRYYVKIDTLLPNASRTFYFYYNNPTALSTSTVTIFNGPYSSTNQVTGGSSGGTTDCQRGFRFSPNTDILVTSLGKNEPSGTPRPITIFNFATQAILAQTTVSGAAATYSYAPLTNPIWLTNGTQYLAEMFSGSVVGYYFGVSTQINTNLTLYDMRYCNSCAASTFPTNTLTGQHYGYPDFQFYTKSTMTTPPTVVAGGTSSGPQITRMPTSLTTCPYLPVSFKASASTGAAGKRWQINDGTGWVDLSNSAIYQGTTLDSLVITNTTPAMNGYQFRFKILGGCSGFAYSTAATLTISNVNTTSALITYDSAINFCAGSGVVLNGLANPGYKFQWSRNGQRLMGDTMNHYLATTSGMYTLKVSNNFGCSDSSPAVQVIVYPKPSPVIIANGLQLRTATSYSQYQWIRNMDEIPGATLPTYTINQNGLYTVSVTDANGCDSTSAPYYLGNLAVYNTGLAKDIKIHPNPVKDIIHISAPQSVNAFVRTATGQLVLYGIGVEQLDASALAAGTYSIQITDKDGAVILTEKLVKRN